MKKNVSGCFFSEHSVYTFMPQQHTQAASLFNWSDSH